MTREEQTYSAIAKLYMDKSKAVHVVLKNGSFYNGYITELNSDFFLMNERLLGETPVFFIQIAKLEPYFKEGVSNGG